MNIPEYLNEKLNLIPSKPGIYQMKDSTGNIIYVGKSKCLKSRVKSYFVDNHKIEKVKNMVQHIHDIDIIVTDTHLEARLLECMLIKTLQPFYNVQFKNDKKYRYLKIEDYNRHKIISAVIEKETDNCFGPYKNRGLVEQIVQFFENLYPLTKDGDLYGFTYNLLPNAISKASFETNKQCLIEIFTKEQCMVMFLEQIEHKMNKAAEEFHFEVAILYRDMLSVIKYLHYNTIHQTHAFTQKNVLMGEKLQDGYKLFYISKGIILLKKKYKRLRIAAVEKFLDQALTLDQKVSDSQNEKSSLDFNYIINSELRDDSYKSILILDERYDIQTFLNKLLKIKFCS